MTTLLTGEKARIARLRVRGTAPDPLAARLRLESWLGAADLHPRALPPSAIVCVRKLSAPGVHLSSRRGEAQARDVWGRRLADTLDHIAARAARPIDGPPPPTAEAVLFADRAELLACLALDWRAGVAPSRWWWQGILRGGDATRSLLSEWMESPAHAPAALEHLARRGMAAEFVGALGTDEARTLSQRVAQVFGLQDLLAALTSDARAVADDELLGARVGSAAEREQGSVIAERAGAPTPPWRHIVPESRAPGIAREQECLLGVGLTLARAPSYARAPSFTRGVTEWRAGGETPSTPYEVSERAPSSSRLTDELNDLQPRLTSAGEGAPEGSALDGPTPRAEDAQREHETPRRAGGFERESEEAKEPGAFETRRPGRTRGVRYEPLDAEPKDEAALASEVPKAAAEGRAHDGRQEEREAVFETNRSQDEARPFEGSGQSAFEPEPRPPYLLAARVETKLGGLFYLINAGLFLELYGDFTTPLRPGLTLSMWDFVALVGRRLCGEDAGEDAVWPLLARLAGRREEEEPGLDFEPPDEWRVPAPWLAPFPEAGVWRWSSRGGRLRVRHQEGFVLLDVAHVGGDAARRVLEETAPYAPFVSFELRRETEGEGLTDEAGVGGRLGRWVEWVAGYLSARLCRALGAGGPRQLARLLIEHEARVALTATNVDVLFRLGELPIEVRLSGLDRDPGWVPAAGRFVAFRYE